MPGNNAQAMDHQYGTTDDLQTRSSFGEPSPPGDSPMDRAIAALEAARARRVLEIGCG
ncbi:hypothetical protein [Arsenicicoccus dermatophilus]|uniref:hypothetical protein n=1 Tax=Arsenicicoccus dermatophilus TaxID=1076331 RepID=UPI001F4C7B01|nr:hypothetical protein [Arsenicicoccus dermatophilus]MCH8612673.1 hypothetical protein [Arsenicicoccus dermatophilus]